LFLKYSLLNLARAGLKRDPPASAFRIPGIQAFTLRLALQNLLILFSILSSLKQTVRCKFYLYHLLAIWSQAN
jgi:hypothetical protein